MPIRIMASRHSAFYSLLLCCIRFLRDEGHEVTYSVLGADQRTYALIRDGAVDIVQSAVSSNWKPRERGVEPLPVHFAQINQRDGFFLVGRQPDPAFGWKKRLCAGIRQPARKASFLREAAFASLRG